MNSYNAYPRAEYFGLRLRECACGAQTFSEHTTCPLCGSEMEPMPDKKPTVKRKH